MKATRRGHIWLNMLLLVSLTLTLTPLEALRASAPEAPLTPLRLPLVTKTWAMPQTPTQDPPPGWLDRITADVARAEYQVTWQDTTTLADARAAYQAPNRAQNLRAYFTPDSLHLVPRTTTGPAWMLNLAVTGYGATGVTQRATDAKLEVAGNGVQYDRGDLVEWYVNHSGGLEQGFTLFRGPSGDGARLVIDMVYDGDLQAHLVEEGAAVEFTAAGVRVLRYGEVHAYDATGAALPAYLELEKTHIRLVVDAAHAVYPLTIDPLFTTPDWAVEGPQTGAGFGAAVSAAGDVNGDGYSDIVIGAPDFDDGEPGAGKVFVYYGSANGPSTTAGWTAEGNQTGAHLGAGVSLAGDVNGDGYGDLIVSAPDYDDAQAGVGAVYVYFGSGDGLSATPDWTAVGDQAGARFGGAVRLAGDVDGDGYSDIIIGAPDYDAGATDTGKVFVYHGSANGPGSTPDWTAAGDQAGAYFGAAAAGAGDVNSDGYADVIVGAPGYTNGETGEGRVFVYHGSSVGLSANADWTAESNQAGASFGAAVAPAGDVNGDGYADIIVGAPAYDNGQTDEGRAFVYHGSAAGLGSSAAWTAESDQAGALLGAAVGPAGDVNGDGYADVVVGIPEYDGGQTDEGRICVYTGSAAGLSSACVWSLESDQAGARLGAAVGVAGDVDGDGWSDVIAGAPGYDGAQSDVGRAYVMRGGALDVAASPGWTLEANQAYAHLGYAVATAGDINGDGYADVVVGAPDYDNGQTNEGRIYVFLGAATGLNDAPHQVLEIDQANAHFGVSVGTAGDVNGDGYSDIIVGADGYSNGQTAEGAAFVYYGSAGGLNSTPAWQVESNQANSKFGYWVSTAGDVNGDGYADVIVGAYAYDNGQTDEGAAFVYHGSAAGLSATPNWMAEGNQANAQYGVAVNSAGDVNGDGYSDVLVGAYLYDGTYSNEGRAELFLGSAEGLSSTPAWAVVGGQANAYLGDAVAGAGDVNGDGYADVVIGAYGYDNGQIDEGRAYVYYGSADGLSTTPDWVNESNATGANYGTAVATAGDVNGDGYADVIIGAKFESNGQLGEGRAYLYLGGPTGLATTPNWTAESNQALASFGGSVGTAGDVNGDGYADVIVGAGWYESTWRQMDEGYAALYYGNGSSGGLGARPRQRRLDDTAPIAPGGQSDGAGVQLALTGRTPLGRATARLQWQVAPLGTPFTATTGVVAGTSAGWTALWATGTEVTQHVTGLASDAGYHWRVRWLYAPDNVLGQPAGRWLHAPWNGWLETDFRTAVVVETPISGLTATNDSPTALGQATTLTATVSAGSNVIYTWAFGDGATGVGATVNHTYPDVGLYTAVVTASNSANTVTATTPVTVGDVPITGLTATNDSPTALGQATTLTATVSAGSNVVYTWAFGDAATGAGATVNHTYPDVGLYTAVVTASNSANTVTATTTVSVGDVPISGLTATNDSPTPLGQATTLTATVSAGSNVVYTWAFGDGSAPFTTSGATGNGIVTTHAYPAAGTYTAVVTAGNSTNSVTATTQVSVTAGGGEAIAGLTATNDSPTWLGQATALWAAVSAGENVSYTWAFGDGSMGSGAAVAHTYANAGTYLAVVTATNSVNTLTAATPVTVVAAVPVADFVGTPLGGYVPLTVTFSSHSTDAASYAWDFGDGSTAVVENPTHTYTRTGVFTVSLTAHGPGGSASRVKADYVTVVALNAAPVVVITDPAEGAVVGSAEVVVSGEVADDGSVTQVWVNDVPAVLDGDAFSAILTLAGGNQTIVAVAQDDAGAYGTASRVVQVDVSGPMVAIQTPPDGQAIYTLAPMVTVAYNDYYASIDTESFAAWIEDASGVLTDVMDGFSISSDYAYGTLPTLAEDTVYTLSVSIADEFGHTGSDRNTFYVPVGAGDIEPPWVEGVAGWVSGHVYDAATCDAYLTTCEGLAGAHITLATLDNATRVVTEDVAGTLVSGPSGFYAFPIAETGIYALRIEKAGYTYGQREAAVVRGRSTAVNALYLTAITDTASIVTGPLTQTFVHTSTNGGATIVVEIPPEALAAGQTVTVTATNFPHVEFLPSGALPPGTMETYAFNLGGDSEITFTQPITVRLENYRGFAPGTVIPLGYWNQRTLQWEHVGRGTVDASGDWLVMHTAHFSNFDCNFPTPPSPDVEWDGAQGSDGDGCSGDECPAGESGSFIEYKSGRVQEWIDLPGVNVLGQTVAPGLTYDTRRADPTALIDIQLDLNFDPNLVTLGDYVQFELFIEGQKTARYTFAADPGGDGEVGRYRYLWDGRNALGERLPPGVYAYAAKLSVPYTPQYYWATNNAFGGPPDLSRSTGVTVTATRDYWVRGNVALNTQTESPFGHGWTLEGYQALYADEAGRILVTDGSQQTHYYAATRDRLAGVAQYNVPEPFVAGPAVEFSLPQFPETGTVVSGTLTENTVWTQANSPYVLTGNVLVTTGVTLTIQPGVTVLLDQDQRMIVDGGLQAVGSASTPITFSAYTSGDYTHSRTYQYTLSAEEQDGFLNGDVFDEEVRTFAVDGYGSVWVGGYIHQGPSEWPHYEVFLRELDRTGTWDDDYYPFFAYTGTDADIPEIRAAVDAAGQVWVAWTTTGVITGGIRVFDTATQSFGDAEDFPDTDIRALELDAASGDMWVGTALGANQFVSATQTWVSHTVVSDVQALASDDAGNIWFGTGAGLWQRTVSDTWSSYNTNDNIVDVALDGDGNVWMAVANAGLRVYLTGGEWLTYTAANSDLLTDTVTGLAVDGQGRVWVGYGEAAAGASVLSADRLIWSHVSPDETGMEAVNVVVQSAAGDVWLGGAGAWGASSALYHAYASAAPNTTNGGHWGYLKLNSDAAHLQHVVLEGGGSRRSPMLYVDAAAPVLENLTIRGGGGPGLLAVDALSLTLYNVQTASNVGDGIQLRGGDHYRIISATSQYNQGHGLRLENAGHVVVTGTTLARNARGYGVWSADNATSLVFQDNVVSGNVHAARLPLAHQADGNVWTGNRVNRIDIAGGELDADSVWETALPYRIAGDVFVGANAPATLTLPPGARLLFTAQSGLTVRQSGTLWAMGTLTAPITLERADPNAQWLGVYVNASIPRLSYVTIRGANLGLALTLPHYKDVAVDHLTLAGNGYGLYVYTGGWRGSFTVRESNFIANRDGGLGVGTSYQGVVTATHNYWNSPTGPYNADFNPLGTGDSIAGTGVTPETFTPYLRRPSYLGSLAYDIVNLTPVDHTVLDFVEHNGVYTYTRSYPDGRQVVFDTEGRHLYTLEADGHAVVYTYNDEGEGSDQGLLATMGIVTPGGSLDAPTWVWSFAYSYAYSGDKLAHISYNDDTVAAFTVNAQGNLEQVTFPDDSARRFYYDERGLLTQQVDPLGQVTGYVYDQYGRLVQSIAPATTVYTPATGETAMLQTARTFTPGDSQGLINPYPAPGTPANPSSAAPTSTLLVDSVTYADGSARSGHTNAWGQWTDQTDALGRTTVYTRDASNNLTGLVQPEGDCIVATYDDAGRPTYAARMGAEQCTLSPEQRDPAQMQSTTFTYEARYGQVKTQTDALGQTTVYTYDYELGLGDAGKLVQIAYPQVQDEAGVWVTPVVNYTYNALGLLAEETARDGTVTQYTYTTGYEDECPWEEEPTIPCFAPGVTPVPGLRAQVVRLSGDTVLTTTYTAFDVQGRAQTTIAPDGNVTHTSYDVMGRVISTTSAVGVTTYRTYNAAGRLVTTTVQRPDDSAPVVTEYVYDAEGRQITTRTSAGEHVAESHTYYDANGRRVAVADALGRVTRYVYDVAGQLLYTVDPLGQPSGATAYDLNGRQTWITDTAGTVSYNEYDALGQLARSVRNWEDGVFDPAEPDRDLETRYQYDPLGRTIIVTDVVGAMTRTWYDDAGRTLGSIAHWDGSTTLAECAALPTTRAANLCTQYAYDAVGRTVIVTDTPSTSSGQAVGRMARTFYDAAGRVTARVENWNPATLQSPDQCVLSAANTGVENICTRYGYDQLGRQVTTTNALGQTSLTVYDAYGRAFLSVANWDGAPIADAGDCAFPPVQPDTNLCTVTEYDYDRRSATVDALGRRTEFGYDALGRVVTTTRYLGALPVTTLTHYDLLGQRVGQTDPRGNTVTFVYDALGRQVETVTPEGVITRQFYDAAGRVERMQDAGGKITAYEYDGLGRRIAVSDPLGQITRFAYNALGAQTAMTDANGIVTAYAYDALNRLSAVTENQRIGESANQETNVVTRYAYDVLGNRTVITNARAYTQSFTTYDVLGRPVSVEDALGNRTFTAYDALGRRTVVTDADGLVTHYVYDGLNRLVEIQYSDATVEYVYDALGRRTMMTDTSGVTTYQYDDLGRVIRVTDPFTGVVEYGYDLAGNRTALTVTHNAQPTTTHYAFDADNRLIQVTDWATGTTTYAYDPAGRLNATTLPNGVVTTHGYDPASRLTALTHTHNGALLARYAYTLDATGNRTRVTESVGGVTRIIINTYDALNRQIVSAYSTGEAFTYRYDAVGNRVAMTSTTPLSGTVVTAYTFDAANRLTARAVSDGRAYTYDWSNRGQMLTEWIDSIPVRTFAYDGAGQMVQATVFTLTTEFVYNGLGARVALSVTGAITRYTLDYAAGQRILAETTPTSTVSYLYGHDCLGEFRDDEPLYYLPDAEGYVRQGVDADGAIISAWLFDPDGTVLEGPNGPVSHLICGGVYDWSTGLLYKGGRYFDPSLGIWLVLLPLAVIQTWPGRKKRKGGYPWVMLLCMGLLVAGALTACDECKDCKAPISTPTPCITPTLEGNLKVTHIGELDPYPDPSGSGDWYLRWGKPPSMATDRPSDPGILIEAIVNVPAGSIGKLEWVQNVCPHRSFTRGFDGKNIPSIGDGKTFYLDMGNPYPSADNVSVSSPGKVTLQLWDLPGQPLLQHHKSATINDHFRTFLIWRSNTGDVEKVLGMIEWNWYVKLENEAIFDEDHPFPVGKWVITDEILPEIGAEGGITDELPNYAPRVQDLYKW